jgi:hypothetical protein
VVNDKRDRAFVTPGVVDVIVYTPERVGVIGDGPMSAGGEFILGVYDE